MTQAWNQGGDTLLPSYLPRLPNLACLTSGKLAPFPLARTFFFFFTLGAKPCNPGSIGGGLWV